MAAIGYGIMGIPGMIVGGIFGLFNLSGLGKRKNGDGNNGSNDKNTPI